MFLPGLLVILGTFTLMCNPEYTGGAVLKLGFLCMNAVFYTAPGSFRHVFPAHLPRFSTLCFIEQFRRSRSPRVKAVGG